MKSFYIIYIDSHLETILTSKYGKEIFLDSTTEKCLVAYEVNSEGNYFYAKVKADMTKSLDEDNRVYKLYLPHRHIIFFHEAKNEYAMKIGIRIEK